MKPMFKDTDEVTFDEFRIVRTAEQVVNRQSGTLYDSHRYAFHLVTASTPTTEANANPAPHTAATSQNP